MAIVTPFIATNVGFGIWWIIHLVNHIGFKCLRIRVEPYLRNPQVALWTRQPIERKVANEPRE